MSTPRSAVETHLRALDEAKLEEARASAAGDERQLRCLERAIEVSRALRAFQGAARERYERQADEVDLLGVRTLLAGLESAKVEQTDEAATVTFTAGGERILRLKRIDGQWRVDLASLLGEPPTASQLDHLHESAQAIERIAQDVRDKRYATYNEAVQALSKAMVRILAPAHD